ncbi:MAG: hypothetical protein GC158_00965 [Cyanobacteria bacterium RI_101]|nr:hypothetical protein [Cyanobacteria bacterium RI_101]
MERVRRKEKIGLLAIIAPRKSKTFSRRVKFFNHPLRDIARQFRTTSLSQMLRLILIAIFMFCAVQPLSAFESQPSNTKVNLNTSPDPNHPTKVDVSFVIDDISDIDLSAGNYKITGQMILEWKDFRLAFAPDPKHPNRPQDLDADAAKELLKKIWEPVFEISNEVGERKTGVFSVNIWPDGRIRFYEKFDSVSRFYGDLHLYPYGSVDLNLVMTGFLQDRREMVYRLKRFEFQDPSKPNNFIQGHWTFVSMKAREKPAKRSDDRSVNYSQILFQVRLDHESIRSGSLTIFIPLLVIFLASCALLWIDPGKVAAYSSPLLGGTLTLILTTIALKFSLAKQIPILHYLTMTDLLIIITITMLVVSLMSSCLYIWLYTEKSETLAIKFNRATRVLFPILFVSVVVVSILIMIHHPPMIEDRELVQSPNLLRT